MAISTDGPAHVGWALKRVAASREASRLPGSWESRIMSSFCPVGYAEKLCDLENVYWRVWEVVAGAA